MADVRTTYGRDMADVRTTYGRDMAAVRAPRHHVLVASREDPADRGGRRAWNALRSVASELRDARVGAGLSQLDIARAVGVSPSQVSRIERGVKTDVSIVLAGRLCGVVGLDLSVRTYAGPMRLRDRAQLPMLHRFSTRLGDPWRWRHEVTLPVVGDQRAWDAVGKHRETGLQVWVEAESRIHDVQSLLRRLELKRRDGGAGRLVLLVNDTRANRDALRAAAETFATAFPAAPRSAIAELLKGCDPGDDVLLVV